MNTTYNPTFELLSKIQAELVATKNQENKFGGYKYRSAESILAAVKPLLDGKAFVTLQDEIVLIGDRYYIKATATLVNASPNSQGFSISSSAYAREPLARKGMDEAQCTGSTSSYARKYALCGLFAIDDSRDDPDRVNQHKPETPLTDGDREMFMEAKTVEELDKIAKDCINVGRSREEVIKAYKAAKSALTK